MRRPVTEMNRDTKHRTVRCRVSSCLWVWSAACAALVVTGCTVKPAQFSLNLVHLHSQDARDEEGVSTLDDDARENIATVLDALYGTPDTPRLPPLPEPDVLNFLEISKLQRAAGPTGRDDPQGGERGLYRKHCIHCHGANGDGAGPTAQYLNPYPRDYRMGLFKFKSTEGTDTPPTHEDLKRVLVEGIPGTAMPSFKVLDDGEIDALVHYVKYLSLRGQTERQLVEVLAPEVDGRYLDPQDVNTDNMSNLLETVSTLASTWHCGGKRNACWWKNWHRRWMAATSIHRMWLKSGRLSCWRRSRPWPVMGSRAEIIPVEARAAHSSSAPPGMLPLTARVCISPWRALTRSGSTTRKRGP